jgi:hypothetical protein
MFLNIVMVLLAMFRLQSFYVAIVMLRLHSTDASKSSMCFFLKVCIESCVYFFFAFLFELSVALYIWHCPMLPTFSYMLQWCWQWARRDQHYVGQCILFAAPPVGRANSSHYWNKTGVLLLVNRWCTPVGSGCRHSMRQRGMPAVAARAAGHRRASVQMRLYHESWTLCVLPDNTIHATDSYCMWKHTASGSVFM